jgi:hypothetical protein
MFSPEEKNAVEMARAIVANHVKLRDILCPELVRIAEQVLLEHRTPKPRGRLAPGLPFRTTFELNVRPQLPQAVPEAAPIQTPRLRPRVATTVPPQGSLRWMAQGLQGPAAMSAPQGSLRWMAQGLQGPHP